MSHGRDHAYDYDVIVTGGGSPGERGAREAAASARPTSNRPWPGGTSWCPTTPTPARKAGWLRDTIQQFPTFSEIYVAALKVLHDRIRAADGTATQSSGG
ncbi:hypothetical protein [Streptomyces hokutonensis]|uniref:hypothetical protein n=1 Tax=Streptomyces hokutonensis TaxID=1306990 RepID=UPI00381C1ED3